MRTTPRPEYQEGWAAHEAHLRWTDCPYKEEIDKAKYDLWQKGFEDAWAYYSA